MRVTNASSRDLKENFEDQEGEAVLERIATLPIQSWNYRAEQTSVRHLGPTAQDFYAAFRLGDGDVAIGTADLAGVNLLAAQALEARTAELRAEIAALREANADLLQRLAELDSTVARLASSRNH